MMTPLRAHDYTSTGPPRLVDINELSTLISVPKGTLYNWCYLRRIPFIKAGRSLRFDPLAVIASMPHSDRIDPAGTRWKG
jgi:hypothetical protein